MGIFDVFKTKITEAADKVGDTVGDMKDKVADKYEEMTDKKGDADGAAEEMVAEGSPVKDAADTAATKGDGMMGTIKQNLASGAEKAGGLVDDKTGGKYTDKIDTGVQKAKDMLS